MYKSQRITVITPCLNEEQGIEQVLRRMPEFVDQVIVVDNGSTDRTPDVARSFGAEVIREPVRGYGRAYKRGFASMPPAISLSRWMATIAIRRMLSLICWRRSVTWMSIF